MSFLLKPDRGILEAEAASVRRLERRGFLKGGLSLGALAMLTGCDVTDNEPVRR